jgi:hypothetical protein
VNIVLFLNMVVSILTGQATINPEPEWFMNDAGIDLIVEWPSASADEPYYLIVYTDGSVETGP